MMPRSAEHTMNHRPFAIMKARTNLLKPVDDDYRDSLKSKQHNIDENNSLESQTDNGSCNKFVTQQKSLVMSGITRSQTLHSLGASLGASLGSSLSASLSASSTSSVDSAGLPQESLTTLDESFTTFGMDLRRETDSTSEVPYFNSGTRRAMEPHLRKARLQRENVRHRAHSLEVHHSIASSVGVPYVRIRSERPFLFDVHTHPIHEALTDTLGVSELSRLHEEGDLRELMAPLRTREGRRRFQESYDNFVTSFCIPLLHSLGMSKNLFHATTDSSSVSYRYQAFPSIRIVRPGETSQGPQCDTTSGHSIGYLHFHIPLTPCVGTNALYTESHPGREDWHPLLAKSVGLGFLFDGARCLHFNMENTTETTSVALDFRIAIYGDNDIQDYVDGDSLCTRAILEDDFSLAGPGYYDEAVIDVGLGSPAWQIVAKKYGNHLLDPDQRVGFPFS